MFYQSSRYFHIIWKVTIEFFRINICKLGFLQNSAFLHCLKVKSPFLVYFSNLQSAAPIYLSSWDLFKLFSRLHMFFSGFLLSRLERCIRIFPRFSGPAKPFERPPTWILQLRLRFVIINTPFVYPRHVPLPFETRRLIIRQDSSTSPIPLAPAFAA